MTNENVGNCTVMPVVWSCRCRLFDVRRIAAGVAAAAAGAVRGRLLEPEKVNSLHVADLLKNGTTVRRTKRRSFEITACTVSERAFGEHHDHRLMGGGKVADDRNHADHERASATVGHEGLLAVEQRDLGRLQHVGAAIALRRR